MKGVYYKDLSPQEQAHAYKVMKAECSSTQWINDVFVIAWSDYVAGKFKYDGATFVQENKNEFWEVASFIHDWLNIIGYVGKQVDLYFIDIMIALNYPSNIIFERCKWMQWTWLNVLVHRIKRNFKGDKLPEFLIQ